MVVGRHFESLLSLPEISESTSPMVSGASTHYHAHLWQLSVPYSESLLLDPSPSLGINGMGQI